MEQRDMEYDEVLTYNDGPEAMQTRSIAAD